MVDAERGTQPSRGCEECGRAIEPENRGKFIEHGESFCSWTCQATHHDDYEDWLRDDDSP